MDVVKFLGTAMVWECIRCDERYIGIADEAFQKWQAFHIVHEYDPRTSKWYMP
jgi:hypothetical protein